MPQRGNQRPGRRERDAARATGDSPGTSGPRRKPRPENRSGEARPAAGSWYPKSANKGPASGNSNGHKPSPKPGGRAQLGPASGRGRLVQWAAVARAAPLVAVHGETAADLHLNRLDRFR